MPPHSLDLERGLAPEAEPDDILGKVGPTRKLPGTRQANRAAALRSYLQSMQGLPCINGFGTEHVPLSIDHHTILKVDVGHRADDLEADHLLFLPGDSQRIRRLESLPFARQRDVAPDGLFNGTRQQS
jgi:hypothetical protein